MSSLIGQSLGRYHILEQLGEGGMATVYKAYDTRLETDVAVKVIRTENMPQNAVGRALKRFEREAKALARLTHPNIVKVTDFGEHDGRPYLVMPYIPGGTLKHRLTGRPVPWQEAAQFLLPIANALDYAHRQGMVHRDVKPSNILITTDGEPMLSDFGVAKILTVEETQDLTGTGAGVGTPEYMAPEQATSKIVDYRADIYAIAVVFFEMVTGRKPYIADTPMAVIVKHASEPLPRPKSIVPGLPDAVEGILLRALTKRPEDRYQSMGEMAGALGGLRETKRPTIARPFRAGARESKRNEIAQVPAGADSRPQRQAPLRILSWAIITGAAILFGVLAVLGRTAQDLDVRPGSNQTPTPVSRAALTVISVENAAQMTEVKRLGKGNPISIQWSSDGSRIVLSTEVGVYVHDAATLVQQVFYEGNRRDLKLTRDNQIVGVDPQGQFVDAAGGALSIAGIDYGQYTASDLAPDSKLWATGYENGDVLLSDFSAGSIYAQFSAGSSSIWSLVFSPDGSRLAAGDKSGTITVWDVPGKRVLLTFYGHPPSFSDADSPQIRRMAFSRQNNLIASGGYDKEVAIWDIETGSAVLAKVLDTEATHIDQLAFSPDGSAIAVGIEGEVQVWIITASNMTNQFSGFARDIHDIEYSPDGNQLGTIDANGTVQVWDLGGGTNRVLPGYFGSGWPYLALSPDNKYLAASLTYGSVLVWDLNQAEVISNFKGSLCCGYYDPVFSSEGIWASYQAFEVELWSAKDNIKIGSFKAGAQRGFHPASLAISSDGGTLGVGTEEGHIYVWDLGPRTNLEEYQDDSDVVAIAFSTDGGKLATGTRNGTLSVWNRSDGSVVWSSKVSTDGVYSLQFSPDGSWLWGQTADQNWQTRKWDARTGALLTSLEGWGDLVLSPDGSLLATAGEGNVINVFNTATGESLVVLRGHTRSISDLAFSSDGKYLVSYSRDGTIRFWAIP